MIHHYPILKLFFEESGYFEYARGHEGAHGISISNQSLESFHDQTNNELGDIDFGEGVYNISFIRSAAERSFRFNFLIYTNTKILSDNKTQKL